MHQEVQSLLEVQKVDQVIARLRRDLESIPNEEARRRARLDDLRAKAEQARTEMQTAELRERDLELSVKQSEGEIENLEGKLNTIKNNAEYQAILFQIESVKKERNVFEEEGLAILENLDGLRAAVEQTSAAAEEEAKIFDGFQTEAKKTLADRQQELDKVNIGRDELLSGLTPELNDEYDRLFGMRDGLAVVAVEAQVCQGCYTNITMNDLARLQAGSMVVQCKSCQRILYLPE